MSFYKKHMIPVIDGIMVIGSGVIAIISLFRYIYLYHLEFALGETSHQAVVDLWSSVVLPMFVFMLCQHLRLKNDDENEERVSEV